MILKVPDCKTFFKNKKLKYLPKKFKKYFPHVRKIKFYLI